MLWESVYIGSQVVLSSIVGLCHPWPTKESGGTTRHRATESLRDIKGNRQTKTGRSKKKHPPALSTEVEEATGLGILLALEPRIMFDGAALVTGAEVVQEQVNQDLATQDQDVQGIDDDPFTNSSDLLSALSSVSAPSDRKETVFIDTSVEGYQTLLEGIEPSAEAVLLDPTRDGMEQIAEILRDRSDIDAIHIISHGNQGELRFGTGVLNLASMQGEYADELTIINEALTDEADFLIYGCNFGEGENGQEAANLLAELTGADVAASIDDTGSAQYKADWNLEYQTGTIETQVAVSAEAQENWVGKLAVITVDTFADVVNAVDGLTSLREAIIAANAGGGGDTINLAAGTYTLSIGGTGENAAATGDLDILESVTITGAGAGTTIIDANGIDRVFHLPGSGTSTATISGITIQNGDQDNGGGIFVGNNRTLNLSDSILTGNNQSGAGSGGAIHVHGTANLDRVLMSGNTADLGGAIGFHGADGGSLTNVTISGNTTTDAGGGIWNDSTITVTNSTITGNSAFDAGGIYNFSGTIAISNTIIEGNSANNSHDDVRGTFNSDGFNLIENVTGSTGFESDIAGVSANLGVLADNGGTTWTHALLAGSLAINAGANQAAPSTDARNIARNEIPDIGAYESTAAASKLYWAEDGSNAIFRSNTDGSAKQQILSGLGNPTGLDVDVTGGKIYWVESATTSLHRANLDGSTVEDLDTANLVNPQGIGLDLVNSHIYVADDGNGVNDAIRRFNLDGTGFTTIVNSLSGIIRDVAADPTGGKLYFTDFGGGIFDGKIKSTNLGGGPIQDVVTAQAGPTSLTLDVAGGKVYWSDNGSFAFNSIKRADLDGLNLETIDATGLQDPYGIGIDLAESKVYWSDQTSNFIRRSDDNGTNDEDVVTGLNSPREVAVIRVGGVINTAPTLDLDASAPGNNFAVTFTEGDGPTAIADMMDTDLVDADSTTFDHVTLSISGLQDGNDEVLVLDGDTFALATAVAGQDTGGGNYRVVMTTGSGTATVTITKQGGGTFTEIETETLIEAIQYQHTDTNAPTDGDRLIDVTVNDGITDSAAARSTINVNPVNDPPLAVANNYTVNEGSTNTVDLAGNDSDADDGLDLTSITIIAGPANGTIDSINADGTVTYTHNGSETLVDSFTYTIDDLSGVTSNTVTVSLIVTPQNDPPVAVTNGFTINEGSTNNLDLAGNDTDADDGLDLTSITIIAGPANGTIDSINAGGTVTYTHNGSETLADSFTYTIRDLAGATSNTVTVSLTVTPQNDAPIITSDGGGATAGVSVLTSNTAVTTVNATDGEGSPITYSIIGGADAALFSIDPTTGELIFNTTPDVQTPGDVGGDNVYDVIVRASDGTANDTQAIAVTVTDVPVVVLPPPPDPSPDPPADDSNDEDTGESEEEISGNAGNTSTNSQASSSTSSEGSAAKDLKDSNPTENQGENDLAAIQERAERQGMVNAVSDLLKLLQKPFDSATFQTEMQSLLSKAGFLQDLDRVRDEFQGAADTEKVYLASSIAASSGLSIGYVIWLLRSGVLLTALLSSVPAWQFVNPLLILDAPTQKTHGKSQEDLEDDSVEAMFENHTVPEEASETKTEDQAKTDTSSWTRRTSQ